MRGRRHKLQVSTFPFLAVLLCAMGSLILVLLVMDRKAHRAAQARAQREAERLVEESARSATAQQAERERLQQQARSAWEQKRDSLHDKLSREQIDMQLQMRKLREQLQEIAARLHYEQDTTTELRRKVQDERGRLQAEEQLLRSLRGHANQTENHSTESNKTLRRMTLDLLQMEQALKDLKAARQREQHTFSVVPYHGRRGENRRPLYVECTADGVIFHPERKAMSIVALLPGAADPSGDVRAEVERRIARQRQKLAGLPNKEDTTPYLLLLLRPAGVNTYHLFQAALKGLPLDFGYEFIDDDWVLDFPADDEMPNTQPWMVATKTSNRPAAAPSAAVSPSRRTSDRPIGLAPMGDGGGTSAGGIRGFRASETGGTGNWVRRSANQSGSPTSGGEGGSGRTGSAIPSGVAGGTGSAIPSGVAGGMGMSPSARGLPGRGGGGDGGGSGGSDGFGGGTGLPGGPGSNAGSLFVGQSANLFGPSGGSGSAFAGSSSGAEPGARAGGMGVGLSRGNGRGHPAALAPSFGDGGDGIGYSGDGGPPGDGYRGAGAFSLRGQGSGTGYGSGSSMGGSPGGSGSGVAGLGPPRALFPNSLGEGSPGGGGGSPGGGAGNSGIAGTGSPGGGGSPGGSGIAGTGSPSSGVPGNGIAGGVGGSPGGGGSLPTGGAGSSGIAGTGSPGSGVPGDALGAATVRERSLSPLPNGRGSDGRYVIAGGNNGGNSSGQPLDSAAVAGTAMAGASQGSGSPGGTAINNGSNPGTQGAGGSSSGTQTVQGGSPSAPANGGAPAPANGRRSSDVVIYLDPLTGKPTTAPRPTPQADGASDEEPPPEETDGNRGRPRVRVVVGNGGGSRQPADPQAEAINRIAPTPSFGPPPRRRLEAPRPAWVHGGRDWTIYIECRADDLVLYPSQRTFAVAPASGDSADNPLLKAIQQMIDRRQSSRKPGEPPYRPQLCLLVRPEHVRTFRTVYPALEALPVSKTRRNLDDDDDVIGIVTGAVP